VTITAPNQINSLVGRTAELRTVTPESAAKLLERNTGNRRLRQHRVDAYAADMASGQWLVTGAPVVIDRNGNLIDGQHRLAACVQAGVPFKTLVFNSPDEGAFVVIDSGLARTAGDALGIDGIGQGNDIAAAARLVLSYENGSIALGTNKRALTAGRQDIRAEAHTALTEYQSALAFAHRAVKALGGPKSAATAFDVLVRRAHSQSDAIDAFEDGLTTGIGLEAGDARLALRTWLMKGQTKASRRNAVHLSVYIRAWNAYANGRSMRNVRPWNGGSFPKLVGDMVGLDLTDDV
jgi:hypothetical protein